MSGRTYGVFNSITDRDAQHLVWDGEPDLCREQITLAQDADPYKAGTVLKDDGAGKRIRWDGIGDPSGILYAERHAVDADERGVENVRHTVYKIPLLVWADGVTEAQKLAGMASMKAKDITGRPAF